jgi:hypothetical protein
MKVSICDDCYHDGGKMVQSKWRGGYKGGWKVDKCDEHKDAGPKTGIVDYIVWIYELQGIKISLDDAKLLSKRGPDRGTKYDD